MERCRQCHNLCKKDELTPICQKSNNHGIWCHDCIINFIHKNMTSNDKNMTSSLIIKCELCDCETKIEYEMECLLNHSVENTYIQGNLHGENVIIYHEEFNNHKEYQIRSICNYHYGTPYGNYIEYTTYGKKCIEANYNENGKYDGYYKSYDDNGNIEKELQYKDGKLDGVQKYYQNGKLLHEEYYSNGVKSGVWKYYFIVNPKVYRRYKKREKYRERYVKDKDYDEYEEYLSDVEEDDYSDEIILKKMIKDNHVIETEKVIKEEVYENGTLIEIRNFYLENVNIKRVRSYQNNVLHGIMVEYDVDGKELKRVEYKNGKPYHGIFETLEKSESYENGVYHGDVIDYYVKNKKVRMNIQRITPYVNGKKDGIMKEYNQEGDVIKEVEYKDDVINGKYKLYNYQYKIKTIEMKSVNSKNMIENKKISENKSVNGKKMVENKRVVKKSIYKGHNYFRDYASFGESSSSEDESEEYNFMEEQFQVNKVENKSMMETEDTFMKRLQYYPYEFT